MSDRILARNPAGCQGARGTRHGVCSMIFRHAAPDRTLPFTQTENVAMMWHSSPVWHVAPASRWGDSAPQACREPQEFNNPVVLTNLPDSEWGDTHPCNVWHDMCCENIKGCTQRVSPAGHPKPGREGHHSEPPVGKGPRCRKESNRFRKDGRKRRERRGEQCRGRGLRPGLRSGLWP